MLPPPPLISPTETSLPAYTEARRRAEVEDIFEQNRAGSPAVLSNLANAMRGVQGDMYWAVDRFVFELLQNADDLPAQPGGSVRVQIRLLPTHLLFQHTGLSFRYEHVLALANVGKSTKTGDATTTGYKGIGFKSVYSESACVYVRSGGYSFRFASDGDDEVPWQTWPRWTELAEYPAELRAEADFFDEQQFSVCFGLQVRPDEHAKYADVLHKLFLDPRFALFLRSLDDIRVVGEDLAEFHLTRTRQADTGAITFQALGRESTYLRHSYPVDVTTGFIAATGDGDDAPARPVLPAKLEGVPTVTVQFAATLDPSTNLLVPMNPAEAVLSAYLPTEDTSYGLALLVNADFTLTSSREKVTLKNQWNEFLFQQIGRLLIQWLADRLREEPARARTIYQFVPTSLPLEDNPNHQALVAGIAEGIKTTACVASADTGKLVMLDEAVLDVASLYQVLPDFYRHYLTDGLAVMAHDTAIGLAATELGERFDLLYIELPELQAAFTQADVKSHYTPADAVRLLRHLATSASLPASWLATPWLFDQDGELAAPNAPTLYGALSEAWDPDFPLADQVRYLHPAIQEALRTDETLATWLADTLNVVPYARKTLVKRLLISAACLQTATAELRDGCVLYFYGLHRSGELAAWLSEPERQQLTKMVVLCEDGNYYYLNGCFLSKHYQPPFELEVIADEIGKEQFPLVSGTYLQRYAEPAGWRAFWTYLNIATPDAADLLRKKLLPAGVSVAAWTAAKHEAVLRLALTAYVSGKGPNLPLTELPKLKARTVGDTAPLPDCTLPLAYNPNLALLSLLPIGATPASTLAPDYFATSDTDAVANFFRTAGCKVWDEPAAIDYACRQVVAAALPLSASVAAVRQLYAWEQGKQLTTAHKGVLAALRLYQVDGSLQPAVATFFSSSYGPEHDLAHLSGGQQQQLLSPDYLPANLAEAELAAWRLFFESLGVVGKFSVQCHDTISRASAASKFPEYIAWVDGNPTICPLPYANYPAQQSLRAFIAVPNLRLVTSTAVAHLVADALRAFEATLHGKPLSIYHTSYNNSSWPAGSLLCAFPVVPCTGTRPLRPAHEVYSKLLAAVPAGAPVATVSYGSLEYEQRLGLKTQLSAEAALELLAQVSAGCTAGQAITEQAKAEFAKTLAQVLPWLTDKAKIPATWRAKLLLPAVNGTWVGGAQAHLVTRQSLRLKTSGAVLSDLSPSVSNEKHQQFATALGIPILAEKDFRLATIASANIITQTHDVVQRLRRHRLFALLCDYAGQPITQVATWQQEVTKLAFLQVPALQRECLTIPGYRIESANLQHIEDTRFYFVGHLWSACHWQALATFLVNQLDLPVPAHVVIRLLETDSAAGQASVFTQAQLPIPALLQQPTIPPVPAPAPVPNSPARYEQEELDEQPEPYEPADAAESQTEPTERFVADVPAQQVRVQATATGSYTSARFTQKAPPAYAELPNAVDRLVVGKWCEELIYKYFLERPTIFSAVNWVNQHEESGKPYDFIVVQSGITRYIEVKGTPSLQKNIIYLSAAEWQCMFAHKENYSLFRVYHAGKESATYHEIINPSSKILAGELTPNSIELQV